MKKMMNTMIPLTIANTLDQTNKQRIEAKANQTLKSVIQQQNLAPAGQFDVYDQSGKVISNDVHPNIEMVRFMLASQRLPEGVSL